MKIKPMSSKVKNLSKNWLLDNQGPFLFDDVSSDDDNNTYSFNKEESK